MISAAIFCRVGTATVSEFAQRLSDQLAVSVDGFADALRATAAPGITIGDVNVGVRDVHAGGTVSGVALPRQDGKHAFNTGVSVPLRRLRDQGVADPIVLLVDAIDEAADVGEVNTLSRLLSKLSGIHLIVTSRSDPSVLSDFRAATHKLDLIADAPADDDDVLRYIRNRLTGQGPEEMVDVLADQVSGKADGNFLYAFYVTGTLIGSQSLAGLDEKTARSLPLPTGGLPGVYEDFLDRQIAGDDTRWTRELRPVLAELCVALGDGFTTAQLAAIASHLTGEDFSLTKTRDVTRAAGQFLEGPRPNGPFRVYHQSFSQFLTDSGQNPNWPIDLTETNTAVTRGLIATVPDDPPGVKNWGAASPYVRRHLAAHASAAGMLDDLVFDPDYLLAAHTPGLLATLNSASSPAARLASATIRRVAYRLADPADPARGSYLRLSALQVGASILVTEIDAGAGHGAQNPAWFPVWAWWRPAIATQVIGALPSAAKTLDTLETGHGPLAVAGGAFGLQVWDLEGGQLLAARPWKVEAATAGYVDGRPVAMAAHKDGIIALYELPSLQILARHEAMNTRTVLAVALINGTSTAVTGDEEGTLVLWQLPGLKALITRPKAHTMVRGLSGAASGMMPLITSVGDTLERDGHQNPDTRPVRVWTFPELHLHRELETDVSLSRFIRAASTPQGCLVAFERGTDIEVDLIADDGTTMLIGREKSLATDLLVLAEGSEPEILLCSDTLSPLRITLPPAPVIELGRAVEVGRYGSCWAGPVDLHDRRVLVSAASTLQAWDLSEVLTASQQDDSLHRRKDYNVEQFAVAGDVLAALAQTGSIHRWQWRSEQIMAPLAVRSEKITTLATCKLAGRPHFAVAYGDGVVEAFDANSGARWPIRIEAAAPLQAMAVGMHRGCTVVGTAVQLGLERSPRWGEDRPFYGVRLWDLSTGTEIPTRLSDDRMKLIVNPDNQAYTWKLRAPYSDKKLYNLAAVQAADDMFFVAGMNGLLAAWPLEKIGSTIDMYSYRDDISMISSRDGLVVVITRGGQWELWSLENGAREESRGKFSSVAVLEIGSRYGTPVFATGGWDGWLRLWSQTAVPLMDIEIGEPVTALAFLSEDRIAVGTGRGVVVVQLLDAKLPPAEPIMVKLAELRVAAREQEHCWDWRSWRRDHIFPPATPEFHRGPAREIAELLDESPIQAFRGLSSWLVDETPLAYGKESTVADIACTLMGSYSHAAFDELCDCLADTPGAVGGDSKAFSLVQALMTTSPDAGASVCERWTNWDANHAQLTTACAHQMLLRDPSPTLRARLLAVELRILDGHPTPLARTEALHALAEWPETRDRVIDELTDRFLDRAEGYVSASTLSKAMSTHFELISEAFKQKIMHNPAEYGSELTTLARYAPNTDPEAEYVLAIYRGLWEAGPGEPVEEIVSALTEFAEHPSRSRDDAVTLAFTIAQTSSNSTARDRFAEAAFSCRSDAEFREQIVDTITCSTDQEMKRALAVQLAKEVTRTRHVRSLAPDENHFVPILQAAADQLEANARVLLRAAKDSKSFASALTQVVQRIPPETRGRFTTFAEEVAGQTDP
jgi:WD40 repeat protein